MTHATLIAKIRQARQSGKRINGVSTRGWVYRSLYLQSADAVGAIELLNKEGESVMKEGETLFVDPKHIKSTKLVK